MKKHTLALSLLTILAPPIASADNLSDAFKNGTVSGDLNLFYKGIDNRTTSDSGYGTGFLGLKYETAPLNGLQLGLAFRHGSEIDEDNPGDSDEGVGTLVTEAYISYQGDQFGAKLGRQEIDLEWVADFHEAITVTTSALPNTDLTAGFSRSFAVANEDELNHSFADISDDGAYFLDAKITPMEGLTLNPYYVHEDEIYNGIGLKVEYEHTSGLGITAHYATSDVDVAGENDGNILHLELRGTLGGLALKAGFIDTDKDGGVGHFTDLGENIKPLEEGNQVYVTDAETLYLGAEYTFGSATVGLMVGNTDYAGNADEREIDLTLAYDLSSLADNLSLNMLYANIDANSSSADYEKFTLMLSYGF
ncbi:Opr family porin [Sedimenticola selenatireducens]|uniref:Opr family porin n=1 Tax=Sedimenticola selenatireducens TaxID=191960 RepID=UPI0016425D5D|nr:Opr family porin [Sedimenticola selenatireducens]